MLDRRAMDDAGIDPQIPVTLKADGLKARSVLKLLCRPLELEAVPRGDMLLVTTKDEASQILETRVYDVRDLFDYDAREQRRLDPSLEDREDLRVDGELLVSLVEYATDRSSWDLAGGPGSIALFGETLVVSQTDVRHEQIAAFLARLRQILRQRETKQPSAAPNDAVAMLRSRLEQRTSVDFAQRPLQAALGELGEKHKIRFHNDLKALDDAGLSGQTPVTVQRQNVALGTVLREMLRQFDLTHVVSDDLVLITTVDEAGEMVYPVTYDVIDLIDPDWLAGKSDPTPHEEGFQYDYDSLLEVVTSTVAPTTWDESGPYGVGYLGTVTWVQTQEMHAEIAELIARLRHAHQRPVTPLAAKAAESPPPVADPNAMEVRVYKLDWMVPGSLREVEHASPVGGASGQPASAPTISTVANDYRPTPEALRYTQQVGEAIVALIERESWQQHGGLGILHAVPSNEQNVAGTVIVRQTAAVHKQIGKLLRDIKSAGPSYGGFGGGFY
jgi:hypothetical protein